MAVSWAACLASIHAAAYPAQPNALASAANWLLAPALTGSADSSRGVPSCGVPSCGVPSCGVSAAALAAAVATTFSFHRRFRSARSARPAEASWSACQYASSAAAPGSPASAAASQPRTAAPASSRIAVSFATTSSTGRCHVRTCRLSFFRSSASAAAAVPSAVSAWAAGPVDPDVELPGGASAGGAPAAGALRVMPSVLAADVSSVSSGSTGWPGVWARHPAVMRTAARSNVMASN